MNFKALMLGMILTCSNVAIAADKIESVEIAKGIAHYENSKFYSAQIPLHFEGMELTQNVKEVVESKSIKLRSSARPRKDKDDSALEIKLKIRGVCNYVFSSVVAKLQSHAVEVGADAVINIRSNYAGAAAKQQGTYDCIRGAMLSAVEMNADFVRLNP